MHQLKLRNLKLTKTVRIEYGGSRTVVKITAIPRLQKDLNTPKIALLKPQEQVCHSYFHGTDVRYEHVQITSTNVKCSSM